MDLLDFATANICVYFQYLFYAFEYATHTYCECSPHKEKYEKICNPSLINSYNFVLSIFLAKFTYKMTFLLIKNIQNMESS